jgi:hypothetical protein
MKRALALGILIATVVGCGRVGPPVRRQDRPPPDAVQVEEDEEEDEEEEMQP